MGSRFSGNPIAIHRGTLVMGVPFYTPPGTDLYDSGIAFVFKGASGPFRERWILEPKYPEAGGQFGDSVDIDEGLIAVSALGELLYKGRVYLYSIQAGWKHLTQLTPENTRGLWEPSNYKRPFRFAPQATQHLVPRNSALMLSPMG